MFPSHGVNDVLLDLKVFDPVAHSADPHPDSVGSPLVGVQLVSVHVTRLLTAFLYEYKEHY